MDESSETSSAKDVPAGSLRAALSELKRLIQNVLDGADSTVSWQHRDTLACACPLAQGTELAAGFYRVLKSPVSEKPLWPTGMGCHSAQQAPRAKLAQRILVCSGQTTMSFKLTQLSLVCESFWNVSESRLSLRPALT